MDPSKNYYNVLGLDKSATAEQIKKNYRKLSLKHHPDKGGDENKFKSISEAYSILSNDKKKQQYDISSPHGKNYNPHRSFVGGMDFGFGTDINDIFSAFGFGSPFGAKHEYQEFRENLNIKINVVISLRDVYKGEPIKVDYKRYVHCEDCDGTGFDRDSPHDVCEMCQGTGIDYDTNTKCKYCQGTGKVFTGTCKKCNGEKVVIKDETFNLNNTWLIRNSTTEILSGYGHQSKYFREKIGMVNLNIIYEHLPKYNITQDNKLIYNIDLHYEDAIKGASLKHELLDGKKVNITIPEKTKDGDIIEVKNKGLLKNVNDRDDLLLKINIIIDYEKISDKK